MKNKVIISVLGLIFILAIVIGIIWINSYNKAITKENLIKQKETQIYSAYSNRYEKVAAYIDAIEGANAQILTQIDAIKDARIAFANAISDGKLADAEEASSLIEANFINLISYMEDNPSSWNTINLTSGFMSEFSASTNAVTFAINSYNEALTDYNTFISLFPNNLFTAKFSKNDNHYTAPDFNTELPTFK